MFSCNKESTPESALEDFINYRFESGQSKEDILEMTTGPLYEKLNSLTEEELQKFTDVKDLSKRRLKVLIKNCEEDTCYLTYVLRYVKGNETPRDYSVEVKKIAQVNKVEEKWLLSDVSNVKTYIESKKELKIEEE
tara:strand:- start:1268 stop:1675 length:408 start_codon:yes stop_codon:yes gene_type:complete